ncbi:unnamed protein product, partial [Mesorhabditis spiculigera]
MSIDREIDNIADTLADVSRFLSYADNSTDETLWQFNQTLSNLEDKLRSLSYDISEISQQITDGAKELPHAYVYYALLSVLLFILWLLIVYMAFTAHGSWLNLKQLFQETKNSGRTYRRAPQFERVVVVRDSPPPSYESKTPTTLGSEETMPMMLHSDH